MNIPYEVDITYLEQFCKGLNVAFIYKEVEYVPDEKKSPCFFCSWSRRKVFYELSKELLISKIATGHHKDDALETLFMNMIYHGTYSSLPMQFSMFDGRLQFIRPMIELPEDLLVEYAQIKQFPKLKSECIYDKMTKRKKVRAFIEELEEMNPNAKSNIFKSMSNIIPEYLPGKNHIVTDSKLRPE
ncbi:MAG: tRNA 2-thiocytidine(32) synthetase TtcA [Bacteroidales bacterium]|nr:tRNA 2-thiocytidine(32) synthetase TtcA [Bacteroidales bacterium]